METTSFMSTYSAPDVSQNKSNASQYNPDDDQKVRIVLVCLLYVPILVATITGNIFVFVAYFRDERIWNKTMNTFIINLAFADFLVGVIMLVNLPYYFADNWYLGSTSCIVAWAIDFTATDMSVVTIIAISLDRFLMVQNAVTHHARNTRKGVAITFAVVWIVYLTAHTLLAFLYTKMTHSKYFSGSKRCNLEYRKDSVLSINLFLIEFAIPAVLILVLNTSVYVKLTRRWSRIRQPSDTVLTVIHDLGKDVTSGLYVQEGVQLTSYRNTSGSSENTSRDVFCPDSPKFYRATIRQCSNVADNELRAYQGSRKSNHRGRRRSSLGQNYKAAKLLTVLIPAFFLSWFPYFIYDCYVLVNPKSEKPHVTQIMTFILWSNSAINPLLYASANIYFKQNFLNILRCGKKTQMLQGGSSV